MSSLSTSYGFRIKELENLIECSTVKEHSFGFDFTYRSLSLIRKNLIENKELKNKIKLNIFNISKLIFENYKNQYYCHHNILHRIYDCTKRYWQLNTEIDMITNLFKEIEAIENSTFKSITLEKNDDVNYELFFKSDFYMIDRQKDCEFKLYAKEAAERLVEEKLANPKNFEKIFAGLQELKSEENIDLFVAHLHHVKTLWERENSSPFSIKIEKGTSLLLKTWRSIPYEKVIPITSMALELYYTNLAWQDHSVLGSHCAILTILTQTSHLNKQKSFVKVCHKFMNQLIPHISQSPAHLCPMLLKVLFSSKSASRNPAIQTLSELEESVEKSLLSPNKVDTFTDDETLRARILILLAIKSDPEHKTHQQLVPLLEKAIRSTDLVQIQTIFADIPLNDLKNAILTAQKMLPIFLNLKEHEKNLFLKEARFFFHSAVKDITLYMHFMEALLAVKNESNRQAIFFVLKVIGTSSFKNLDNIVLLIEEEKSKNSNLLFPDNHFFSSQFLKHAIELIPLLAPLSKIQQLECLVKAYHHCKTLNKEIKEILLHLHITDFIKSSLQSLKSESSKRIIQIKSSIH